MNVLGSTIVSGPIYILNNSAVISASMAPTTSIPTSSSTLPPTSFSPTQPPSSMQPTSLTPTVAGFTYAPTQPPSVAPVQPATLTPTVAGYTYVPTQLPSSSPSIAPSTLTPTVAGFTYAPTQPPSSTPSSVPSTLTPTVAGYTYVPTQPPSSTPFSGFTPTVSLYSNSPSLSPTCIGSVSYSSTAFPVYGYFFTFTFTSSENSDAAVYLKNVSAIIPASNCPVWGVVQSYSLADNCTVLSTVYMNANPLPNPSSDVTSLISQMQSIFQISPTRRILSSRASVCVAQFCDNVGTPCLHTIPCLQSSSPASFPTAGDTPSSVSGMFECLLHFVSWIKLTYYLF